jgi:signal transduction histidine kinase
MDICTGKISANQAGWQTLGLRPEDGLTIENFVEHIHPDDRPAMSERIAALTRGATNLPLVEYRLMNRQTGVETWVTGNSHTEFDTAGQPLRLLAILSDVSAQKRALMATERAAEAARQANEAKSQFLANISHELRTPLHGVIGMAQLLQQSRLDREQQEFTTSLLASAKDLQSAFQNMLDLSRADSGKLRIAPEKVDLTEFMQALVAPHRAAARNKQLELALDIHREVPSHWITDPLRLRQILDNLLANAVKFTERGTISLCVAPSGDGDGLEFRVQDSGIGMDAETLASLFQPFHQGDASSTRRYGGSGLGLSIVQRLVALFSGRITVASVPGRGSEFTVVLPVQRLDSEASAGEAVALPTPAMAPPVKDLPFNPVQLVAQAAGDLSFATEIAHAAGDDLLLQWQSLADACATADWATAKRCCHTVKSLALQVAAAGVAERFKTLESRFKGADASSVIDSTLPADAAQDITTLAAALKAWPAHP